MKITKYSEIDHYKDGKYFLDTGEYLWIRNIHKHYFKDENFKILHRDNNLPAIEYSNGDKTYLFNNRYHRTNGPAIDSVVVVFNKWYLFGAIYPEEQYNSIINTSKECNVSIEQVIQNLDIIK